MYSRLGKLKILFLSLIMNDIKMSRNFCTELHNLDCSVLEKFWMVNSKLYHSAKKLVLYYYYYICFLSGLYTRFKESGAGTILILYILEEREEILVIERKWQIKFLQIKLWSNLEIFVICYVYTEMCYPTTNIRDMY